MHYYHNYLSDVALEFELLIAEGSTNQQRIEEIYLFLKETTAEDFGYDPEAWVNWLAKTHWDIVLKGFYAKLEQEKRANEARPEDEADDKLTE